MMDEIMGMFTGAVLNGTQGKMIKTFFKDGRSADYPADMLELFKTDMAVSEVVDMETGELLYVA